MAEEQSVHELLMQFKHGNINAIGILYKRYVKKFYARARNRGLFHEDAEDISEQTFTQIINGIDTYKEDGAAAGWMWKICDNLITDIIRKKLRNPTVSVDVLPEDMFASVDADPSIWQETKEHYAARYCAWKHISLEDRKVLSQIKPDRRSREWKAAQKRLLAALDTCLQQTS